MEVYYSKDKKNCCTNSIGEIIEKIAKTQRDVCNTCANLVTCDACFFGSQFNTIPIRLTLCCSGAPVEAVIGAGGIITTYFRVEFVTNERFVKLRLLSIDAEGALIGTNYTIVLDLECVGSIQCFEPINIIATPVV
jgi:hypothetical protein